MNAKTPVWKILCLAVLAATTACAQATLYKADNAEPLNTGASWDGGTAPTAADIAAWDSRVTAGNVTADIGGALTWDGLLFTDPAAAVTINGTSRLTLDGGAATDLDLSAAAQDLTLNVPLTLSGTQAANIGAGRTLTVNGSAALVSGSWTRSGSGRLRFNAATTNTVNSSYTAGETVYAGAAQITADTRLNGGNVTFKGTAFLPAGSTEALAVYNGTLVLDGGALTMTNASSRIFAGRSNSTSDGLVIVSNGTHVIAGVNNGSMANFIGVSGAQRGRLYLEGGSLSLNYLRLAANQKGTEDLDELVVNGGTLSVLGATNSDPMSKAFKMGTRFDESTTDAATRSARLTVNGGRFEVPNGTVQIASDVAGSTGTQQIFLNGGTWAVKKIAFGSSPSVTRTVVFDGGVLQGTNVLGEAELIDGGSNATFSVRAGGVRLEAAACDFGFAASLAQDPSSAGGGLVKLGSGRVTLSGNSTYTGPTIVSNGMLRVTGTLAVTNLTVAPGAGLSLADGALSVFAPASLRIGTISTPSTLEAEVAASGSACDTLAVPAGAWVQRVSVSLVQQGTRVPLARTGDFPIITYAGTAIPAANLSWGSPVKGFTCTFETDTATRTIYARMRIDGSSPEAVWINPGSGAWSTAANWSVPPADAAGTRVLFGEILASPSTVSLDTPFTVGQVTFSNANAVTLSGAGSLALDNGASAPSLTAAVGAHTVAVPLAPAASLTLSAAAGASLTLGGPVSGAAGLVKQGSGEAVMTAANTYAGGTAIQGGYLALQGSAASLGSGAVSITSSGGRLRSVGAEPVTLSNTVVIAASGAALDAIAPMTFLGTLDWATGQQNMYKYGTGELTFKGTVNETGAYFLNLRTGTFRAAEGANIAINAASRETLRMTEGTSVARTFIVETGAVVVAGGVMTGSGPSNTVHVNGGSLTFTGSGVGGESGLIRTVEDVSGADRFIVDAGALTFSDDDWLSMGVRGGGAEIVVNGGTATFGRLSLGVRADTNFSSTGVATYSKIWVNGGVMDVVGAFNWMGDIRVGRVNQVYLNGGTLRLPTTLRSVANTVANSSELTLNGGTLALRGSGNFGTPSFDNYLSGLNALYVDQGGAVIDTLGHDATITQALQRVGLTTGGLTKRGAGTLTLAGACGAVGTTSVEAGTLRLAGPTAATGLAVSGGAALSLRSGAFETLSPGTASLSGGARLDVEVAPDSAACDRIVLPPGATVGALVLGLYASGTDAFVTRPDDYPVIGYSGTPPDVTGWALAPEAFGVTATFVTNAASQTIDVRIATSATQSVWQHSGSGDWSVSGNWWPQAPASSGAAVLFGGALVSNSTVNVDGAVSVAGLAFNHTFSYALSGSAITLDAGASDAAIAVSKGVHTLACPLTLNGGTVASIAPEATLRITGVAAGAGSLAVQGGGQLSLDGTNTTPTTVRGGATVAVPGAAALGGAALTLDNGTLAVAASDTLAGAISLGGGGGIFRSAAGQTLQLGATVSGAGGLTKAGAGTVALGASAGGYAGATTSEGGTLAVPAMPAGAVILGRGTLAFTGVSGASAQPVTVASGTNAAVLRAEGDLTLSGLFSAASGALIKRGAGTLTLAGANTNRLGFGNAANMNAAAAASADGDGPSAGYGAFNVAEGRVTLGAAGQTNTVAGALLVGLNTTAAADAETAGELVVAGGLTTCSDWVYVGRNNGSTVTAPGGRSSRLLIQDGELNTVNLSLGGASGFAGYTGRPVLEIQGGLCTVQTLLFAGETPGGVSTVWVNGGTLRHLATTDTSVRLGNSGGEGILRVSSGVAELAKDIILAAGGANSTGTVELAGGTLIANNIYEGSTSGISRVIFNGGVFRPKGGGMSGLDSAKIGDGPAIFDTSLYSGNGYNLAQALSGLAGTDGGLIKAGTNTLTVNAAMAYAGPTVVSGGVLRVQGSLPAASALTVVPGARLTVNNVSVKTVTLSGLTLGAAGNETPAELEFGVDSPNATNDQIVVNGDVSAHRAAFSLYWQSSQTDNIVANGSYVLLRWTGSGPVSADAFSIANPQPGKQYLFSIVGQSLRVQVGAATSGANHVWSAAGGGSWSEGAKWVSAPGAGAVGASVRFDESIAASATVLLDQAATAGALYFNSSNAYTLAKDGSAALTVDNGAVAAVFQIEKGRHSLSAPVTLQGETEVKPISGTALTLEGTVSGAGGFVKKNGGELVLAGTNTFAGGVRVQSGTVVLTNGATAGSGALAFEADGAQLRVGGSVASVLPGDVAIRTATAAVNVDAPANLRSAGELKYEHVGVATLYKQGAGELTLLGASAAGNDNARLNLQEGVLRFAAGADYSFGLTNRESVKMDADNSRARTLVVETGAKATLGGVYMGYGTNAVVVDGELAFTGNFDAANLRIQGSTAEDRFTVRAGGMVSCPQATWFNVGVRGPGVLEVDGGAAQLGSVSLGYQQRFSDTYGGAYGRVSVKGGGLLDVTGRWNWMGDSNAAGRVNVLLAGDGQPSGATVRLPPTTQTSATGWSAFALDNGTLVTAGGGLSAPVAGDYLNGLRQLYVSGRGGTIDTAGQNVTLAQPVCSDAVGGTLAKAGLGSLTLAQPLRWDGTVDVRGGELNVALVPASVRQSLPTNLLARYSFESWPSADTSGNGRNGVQRGTASVVDGTNGVKALMFATGASSVCVPCDTQMRGMANFTVAMWLWVNTTNMAAGTGTTFFTTRKDGGSNGPYELMLRMNFGRVRLMSTGSTTSWASADSTRWISGPNQWSHVAVTVTPDGAAFFIDGVAAGTSTLAALKTTLFTPPDRPLNQYGFGFGNYHLDSPPGSQFTGRLDDVRVYSRALTQAEIQSLIDTASGRPDLRVAGGAALALQGAVEAGNLSGEGTVAGAVTAYGRVAPGDSTNAPAGAALMVDELTFATNAVYAWSWSPAANDELLAKRLTIGGAGVVDLGRQEGQLISGSFRAVLMRYESITGAANLAGWTLANAGGKGYNAVIKAENNEVVLDYVSTLGTLMWLK